MSPTRAFALLAAGLSALSVVLFCVYLVATGIGVAPRATPDHGPLPWLIDVGLLLLFAVQHSGMARGAFKRCVPEAVERPFYMLASAFVLATLTLGWEAIPGEPLWHGPLWIEAISLLGVVGAGGFVLFCVPASFFGLRPAEAKTPLRTDGPYRFVRHPLMVAVLLVLWGQPIMQPELCLLNAGLTIYILIAIRFEEHDLLTAFGEEYDQYRRCVPALVPWRIFG